ncbi:MAG: phosphosulfolactate synthase [Thermoplasmata archaeon]|nr:phosphosulfolactate synthase [Candidatus Sysuiplasma acidicola]
MKTALFLDNLTSGREGKPRDRGKTMVLDRIAYGTSEVAEMLSDYIDTVKIGWGIPMLLDVDALRDRISFYKQHRIHVSNGGTMLELSVSKGRYIQTLSSFKDAGFDTIELSEGIIDIPANIKSGIAEFAHSNGLRLNVEIGKKDPRNQLSLDETIQGVESAFDLEPDVVIVEGRETGRGVEIYDEAGTIKWDWVDRLLEVSHPSMLMFEAPIERQQTELILHIGSDVNLGNVSFASVAALETQRQGLRGDTFGVVAPAPEVNGGPASRFVYYVLSTHGSMDQSKIVRSTGLTRRTVQKALNTLLGSGLIREARDPHDMRKRIYSAIHRSLSMKREND